MVWYGYLRYAFSSSENIVFQFLDGHQPLQLWEREKTVFITSLLLRISGYVQRSNKCKVWVLGVIWYMCALAYLGIPTWVKSYMCFSVCRQGVWVSWWWTKLDTEKPNTDSHLCSSSRIIQGYCHGKFSLWSCVERAFTHGLAVGTLAFHWFSLESAVVGCQ